LLRYHILDIDCLFASLNMADMEVGEVPQAQASRMPREAMSKYSGKGQPTLPDFKAKMLAYFHTYDVSDTKQANSTLLNGTDTVITRVNRVQGLTSTNGVAVEISSITFDRVFEALKSTQHDAEHTDKGIVLKMTNVKASTFKGENPSSECFFHLETLRAQLSDPSVMSDTAFQTIIKNALHPQFAIQVSTDRGMAFSSQDAWRH
jgi:hypothetical protein